MFSLLPKPLETAAMVVPALCVAAVALFLWRQYWSMRFWLAAALLYWLIPWGSRALFNASNGTGIRRPPPAWLTEPFDVVSDFAWLLLLVLMALGLLSFHPATRAIDTARRLNTILCAICAAAIAALGWIAWHASSTRIIPPLDPAKSFYPERPLAVALTVHWEPVQPIFHGTEPQFRITLTNRSDADIHLGGLPLGRFQFRPNPYFTLRRDDGHEFAWGTQNLFPREDETLGPGASRTVVVPEKSNRLFSYDETDPVTPTPGEYSAFVHFWLQERGAYQRVLSNVIQFRIDASTPAHLP